MIHSISVLLLVAGAATGPQESSDRPDPIAALRSLVDHEAFGDAAEALAGFPEPVRTREDVYLRFKAFDLAGASAAGERAIASSPNDTEILRILGDIDAMERRFDKAAAHYRAARKAISTDPRLTDSQREAELAAMKVRDRYLQQEREYQELVTSSNQSVRSFAGLCYIFLALLAFISFGLAIGSPRARSNLKNNNTKASI
ncbi:MAG: hypothetical protein HY286_20055 [Planctomycetes bacterium]|nr:hypothetical protein [Planctomycetota bacterium]